ncbi:MAG: hypothetical protein KGO50_10410 [Myxococcales bacterium]|nr:hypothetical protein [Myxococcales bacterium]
MRKRYYGLLYYISIAGLFGFGADAQAEFVLERNAELGQNGLVAERVLEALITGTNASIRTPETIIAGVASCGGVENALYMREPEQSRPVVVICEELVNRIVVDSQSAFSAFPGFRQASFVGQLIFVIAHEFGHALVDVLQLPVTGNEEDVADQFATWILSDEPAALYGASLFWLARSGTAPTASAFADTHALNDGSVAGNGTVAFAAGNCTFDGQFSDADRMTLNGEVLCGGTQTMMGNFQAIR